MISLDVVVKDEVCLGCNSHGSCPFKKIPEGSDASYMIAEKGGDSCWLFEPPISDQLQFEQQI